MILFPQLVDLKLSLYAVQIGLILTHPPNTMLQMSKLLNSRDEWKNKATERAAELRELRKTQKRHLKK
ncbi:hypothetical protein [Methylotuvimicrobium buryatense]|nr:hypothetical protein [Methylotuvimicrobium buryatense]